jgi:uncharacterized membrane protein
MMIDALVLAAGAFLAFRMARTARAPQSGTRTLRMILLGGVVALVGLYGLVRGFTLLGLDGEGLFLIVAATLLLPIIGALVPRKSRAARVTLIVFLVPMLAIVVQIVRRAAELF